MAAFEELHVSKSNNTADNNVTDVGMNCNLRRTEIKDLIHAVEV